MEKTNNGYQLSKKWFDFCLDNPEKIKPVHTALFFWIMHNFQTFAWRTEIGLPTNYSMFILNIKAYKTYDKALKDLIDFGFVEIIKNSSNQYTSKIIALVKNTKANTKASTKANTKARTKANTTIDNTNVLLYNNSSKEELLEYISPKIDFENLILFFNTHRGALPEVKVMSEKRKKNIEKILQAHGKAALHNVILLAEQSDFLQGNGKDQWRASFDWLINPENFIKVLEKTYNPPKKTTHASNNNNQHASHTHSGYQVAQVDTDRLIRELAQDAETGNILGVY